MLAAKHSRVSVLPDGRQHIDVGISVGRTQLSDDEVLVARRLLTKAQSMGVRVTLPVDYLMGDLFIDHHGALVDDAEGDSQRGDDGEADDTEEAAGFEYPGETLEAVVSETLPAHMYALDLGPTTINQLKDHVELCQTLLWFDMVGAAECTAFQAGTQSLLDAVVVNHNEKEMKAFLAGSRLNHWAQLLGGASETDELGNGNGVTHIFDDLKSTERLLCSSRLPGLELALRREELIDEALLEADVAKRLGPLMNAWDEEEEGEEDEDEEEEGDDGDY